MLCLREHIAYLQRLPAAAVQGTVAWQAFGLARLVPLRAQADSGATKSVRVDYR